MLAVVKGSTLAGYQGALVQVEVDVARGFPGFDIVGLADTAVREARERIRSALANNNFKVPAARITVNLAPAALRKHGPGLDLPIALGILLASGQVPKPAELEGTLVCGELSLEGKVRPVRGVLSMVITARHQGLHTIIVAVENAREAAAVDGLRVLSVSGLAELVGWCKGNRSLAVAQPTLADDQQRVGCDLAAIRGQAGAKRALEIAAAGGHNLLLVGPPGAGKTMLANCLPSLMPRLDRDQSLAVSQIYSAAGLLSQGRLIRVPPFRSPHHSASLTGIVGGGSVPRPGEISLAHHGVLFLDEFAEFRREVIEVLRQPLEEGKITIARARASYTFPARFLLVAAANPCPCGFWGVEGARCRCLPGQVARYRSKFSGPIMDRIDIWTEVPAVAYADLRHRPEESSATVRRRVEAAREIQRQRLAKRGLRLNGEMDGAGVEEFCRLTTSCEDLLSRAFARLGISARAYQSILKLARTIADLEGRREISPDNIAEALSYRALDWQGGYDY